MRHGKIRTFLATLSALFLWNCGGGTNGTLAVGLTDASTDQYQAVYVTIKAVEVHKAGASEDSWTTVAEPNKTYDLLTLVNGVRETLGVAELKSGHYTQMRLVLGTDPDDSLNLFSRAHSSAHYAVDLDGTEHELKVPSGLQTGIKIVQGFDVSAGGTTELLLDFDAGASVVVAGSGGKYLLKPTIKVLDLEEASIVSGSVTAGDEAAAGASVSAQVFNSGAADAKDRIRIQAATVTDAEGRFSLFLSPGTYNLVVYKEGFAASVSRVTVAAGDTATQDASLEATATGNLAGAAAIDGGDEEAFLTLSFRQAATVDGDVEEIEVTSRNVADGGVYSVVLPEGECTVVGSSFGETTQSIAATIEAGVETVLDLTL